MIKIINKIINPVQNYFSGKLTLNKFIPGIAWFFILLILLCLPGKDLPETNEFLKMIYFDKWVHTGMFGLLAMLFMGPVFASDLSMKKKKLYTIIIITGLICWGLTTEFIQGAYIEGRSFDLIDWVADICGTCISFFLSKYLFLHSRPAFTKN